MVGEQINVSLDEWRVLNNERFSLKVDNARLRAALKDLFNDCIASDFNEHWDSYLRAKDELANEQPK